MINNTVKTASFILEFLLYLTHAQIKTNGKPTIGSRLINMRLMPLRFLPFCFWHRVGSEFSAVIRRPSEFSLIPAASGNKSRQIRSLYRLIPRLVCFIALFAYQHVFPSDNPIFSLFIENNRIVNNWDTRLSTPLFRFGFQNPIAFFNSPLRNLSWNAEAGIGLGAYR